MSGHRAPGKARMAPYPIDFTPAHCAGATCFHTHAGEPVLPLFADLTTVDVRCERKNIHGSHDHTGGRCPGVRDANGLPTPVVVQHAARARAGLRGGAR